MKKVFRQWVAALSISLMFASILVTTAAALTKETPMRGVGAGQITSVTPGPNGVSITAAGSGVATHLGKFTRTEEILLNPMDGTATGSITFISADGDELYCTFTAAFVSTNEIVGTYTFTGGTGRFEGASGTAPFSVVQSDQINFTFAFAGTIDLQ
jgi:hypothetical protein